MARSQAEPSAEKVGSGLIHLENWASLKNVLVGMTDRPILILLRATTVKLLSCLSKKDEIVLAAAVARVLQFIYDEKKYSNK